MKQLSISFFPYLFNNSLFIFQAVFSFSAYWSVFSCNEVGFQIVYFNSKYLWLLSDVQIFNQCCFPPNSQSCKSTHVYDQKQFSSAMQGCRGNSTFNSHFLGDHQPKQLEFFETVRSCFFFLHIFFLIFTYTD